MTTDNIDGIESTDEILGQLGHLAKEAKQRASAVVRERQGIETRRRNAMRGWRVVERRLRDREEILDEEAIQLDWVLNGDDEGLVLTPDPIVADPEPPASPVVVAPDPPAEPVIVLPDPPEDTPHTPRHLADPPTENVTVVNDHEHVINVRHWTVWQWLGALIGAIIGLVLASVTDQMLFEDNGFGQVLWIIALTGLGFFGGGAIGSTIDG